MARTGTHGQKTGGPAALLPLGCLGLWLSCSLILIILGALALGVTLSIVHALHPGTLHMLLGHLHLLP